MSFAKKVIGETLLKQGLKYLEKDTEKNMNNLLNWADKIVGDSPEHRYVEAVRNIWNSEDSVWRDFIIRLINETDPNVREKTAVNFFLNADLLGLPQQRKMKEKYQCNVPWAILIDPTSACNLRCTGCWAGKYEKHSNLSLETLDRIINEGKKLGIYMYIYSGGEPMVRKDDIIKLCEKHDDCMFLSFTNATLIDDNFVKEVVRVGNLSFAISVEGFEEETDFRRGKGTYKKVIEAMDRLREAGCIFGFSTCYHRKNAESIGSDEYIDFMVEKGCRFGWYFTYVPVGIDSDVDFMATPEQRAYMYKRVREIRSTKPIFALDFWNDGEYTKGCIAGGRNYFHINSEGEAEPCAFIHYSNLNINDCSLLDVLKSPLFTAYKEHQPFNCNHLRPCPLIDNPDALKNMVIDSGAKSTQINDEETVVQLTDKLKPYANSWGNVADKLWEQKIN